MQEDDSPNNKNGTVDNPLPQSPLTNDSINAQVATLEQALQDTTIQSTGGSNTQTTSSLVLQSTTMYHTPRVNHLHTSSSDSGSIDANNNWALYDSTIDDQDMTEELRGFLSNKDPQYDLQGDYMHQGGLDVSTKLFSWLQEIVVLNVFQYVQFGRKEFIYYFSFAKSVTKIRPLGEYLKRTKALIEQWNQTKTSTKNDAAFTPDRFNRTVYKLIYKKRSSFYDQQILHAAK